MNELTSSEWPRGTTPGRRRLWWQTGAGSLRTSLKDHAAGSPPSLLYPGSDIKRHRRTQSTENKPHSHVMWRLQRGLFLFQVRWRVELALPLFLLFLRAFEQTVSGLSHKMTKLSAFSTFDLLATSSVQNHISFLSFHSLNTWTSRNRFTHSLKQIQLLDFKSKQTEAEVTHLVRQLADKKWPCRADLPDNTCLEAEPKLPPKWAVTVKSFIIAPGKKI